MEIDVIILRIFVIIILAFCLGLEREYNHQPAWLRTHILIWLGSTLLMILSIEVSKMWTWIPTDPGRIAAQVVTWIWFIGAWAIMKNWMNTKWLTTAANIWVTAAIWLIVWVWFYTVAIISTILILFNLIIISKVKNKLVKQIRYCNIVIEFNKNKLNSKEILKKLKELPIEITSKEITEDNYRISIVIMAKIDKDINIYSIQHKLSKIKNLNKISVWENFR